MLPVWKRHPRRTISARSSTGHKDTEALDRYATLFNTRDWDGVRALVGDEPL